MRSSDAVARRAKEEQGSDYRLSEQGEHEENRMDDLDGAPPKKTGGVNK